MTVAVQDKNAPISEMSPKHKLLALEGLRGLCALSVLISHLSHDSTGIRSGGTSFFPGYAAGFLSYFGNIGVLVFFVLSGFVIGYTNKGQFNSYNLYHYAVRRVIRIYPIYLVVVLFSFCISGELKQISKVVGNLLLLQTWLVEPVKSNGVLWTLHLEAVFYILYIFVWCWPKLLRPFLVGTALASLISPFVDSHLLRVLGYFHLWLLGLFLEFSIRNVSVGLAMIDSDRSMRKAWWISLFLAVSYTVVSITEILIARIEVRDHGQISLFSVAVISGLILTIVAAPIGKVFWYHYYLSTLMTLTSVALTLAWSVASGIWLKFPAYQLATLYFVLAFAVGLLASRLSISVLLSKASGLGVVAYGVYIVQNPIECLMLNLIPLQSPAYIWWLICIAVGGVVILVATFLERVFQPLVASYLRSLLLPVSKNI